MDFFFFGGALVVFAAIIGFLVGLGMLVFSKDKKKALYVIITSLIIAIIGFGSCVNNFTI